MMQKLFYTLFIVVFLLAGALRLFDLGHNPFVADEFLDVNATYGYAQTQTWHAWDFNHNAPSVRDNDASDRRAWLYRIQVASLYNKASFLPPTETTARLVSALWGIVMTVILYFVTFSLTRNKWIALLAAGLWALSVPAIEINRKIRMYSMFAPMYLLLSWSIYQFLETGRLKAKGLLQHVFNLNYIYLIPIIIFGALSAHLHPLTGNIAFVLIVYVLVRAWQEHSKEGPLNRYTIYSMVLLMGIVTGAVMLPEQFAWLRSTMVFFENHWHYVMHILFSYWHPLIGALLIGFGLYSAVRRGQRSPAQLWIALNFVVVLLFAIFLWKRNVGPQYIFFIQAFGMMLAASGLYALFVWARKIMPVRQLVFAIIIAIILIPNYGYFFQDNNTYHIKSTGESANYRKVFDYVKRHRNKDDVMITRNFRNYYFGGQKMQVFDFGSERSADALVAEGKVKKITLPLVQEIVANHPTGWVVFSDNDEKFITKEARNFFETSMTKITDSPLIRGKISVYRWGI